MSSASINNSRLLSPLAGQQADYVEQLYQQWLADPQSLPESWQLYFAGFELGQKQSLKPQQAREQSNIASLIYGYRSQGHVIAQIDPLGNNLQSHPSLSLEEYGFSEADLERRFDTGRLHAPNQSTLREILSVLKDTYCRTIGVEYMHIQDRQVRHWLQSEMESVRNRPNYSRERKLEILQCLTDAEVFERFIHSRYPGQKRFSLEGGETLIPALHALASMAPEVNVQEIVIGMAHRGRLNVITNILRIPYEEIFSQFEGNFVPQSVHGDGDVKYHKGYSADFTNRTGRQVHLSLTANPSHLEAVNPVVEGRVRAKQRRLGDTERRKKVLPLLIHGDAAFAGQGVVAETLNLSQVAGYRTGGTVHLIINNQIGFTTLPTESRSTSYTTDVAKMIEAPIFHVNGEDPEAVAFVTELALRFRQEFSRDVVIDMLCYRLHGHNESDDPAFTQPVMYAKIRNRPSARVLYTQSLVIGGDLAQSESDALADKLRARLEQAHDFVKKQEVQPHARVRAFSDIWHGLDKQFSHDSVQTAVSHEKLNAVAKALCTVPVGFNLNPKVARRLPELLQAVEQKQTVDWANAELLAIGALLLEKIPVRFSGQDTARGTFSQRHAVWTDTQTQEPYTPLNHIAQDQERFCVYNSTLSEAAVLGFEYGYAITEPRMLIAWEAQFGDFANGAQVMIDQFITGSESKWQRDAGLVLLLPHGYEGQGPEHSNAYLERYLAACADNNVQVCNLTTPSQYFHVLRRQVARPFRLPLVIMAPKSMLRHKRAVSPVEDFLSGSFQEILDDPQPPRRTRRLLLCCGKIFYDLIEKREQEQVDDVAIVRIEQLYPLHADLLERVIAPYRKAEQIAWVQEEPQNRGAWTFMFPILLKMFAGKDGKDVQYIGRKPSASPATGSLRVHQREQASIIDEAILGGRAKDRPVTMSDAGPVRPGVLA